METVFKAGKYLTFRVARQDFAINITHVRGILPVHQMISSPPSGPASLCGFAAVSGIDFPVIDLRAKLEIPHGTHGREPFIVVVQDGEKLFGFIADRVSEVLLVRSRDYRNGAIRGQGRPKRVLGPEQMMMAEDWAAFGVSFQL